MSATQLLCAFVVLAFAAASIQATDLEALITKGKTEELIKALADGEDPNQLNNNGVPAIFAAVLAKSLTTVDALLQHGAVITKTDPKTGNTPLHVALGLVTSKQPETVDVARMLLAYGADPDVKDSAGHAAREAAKDSKAKELIETYDALGAEGFEDEIGTWVKEQDEEEGKTYWVNTKTETTTWQTPPSCAWVREKDLNGVYSYENSVTGQSLHRTPKALSWRLLMRNGEYEWYNWVANTTQEDPPAEVPEEMLEELQEQVNVRWVNEVTGEVIWEHPHHLSGWRKTADTSGGDSFWYHVTTGESSWEAPAELAWEEVESEDDKDGGVYYFNAITGESTWEKPIPLAWRQVVDEL